MKDFQQEINKAGPKTLSFITGVPLSTCKKWCSGTTTPDKYKQHCILSKIQEVKNRFGDDQSLPPIEAE